MLKELYAFIARLHRSGSATGESVAAWRKGLAPFDAASRKGLAPSDAASRKRLAPSDAVSRKGLAPSDAASPPDNRKSVV